MDGRRVLKKGGGSFFGLRPRKAEYELWPTHDGMEIRRDGARFWGVELKTP